jgi:hypothetical protein
MRKRRRSGLEPGLNTEEREGKRAAAGVEIDKDGLGTGGFNLNLMGAFKGGGDGRKLRREAAPVLWCVFKRGVDGGGAREVGEMAGRARLAGMQGSRPEVGGGADGWAPPVIDHVREREASGRWRACWAGSRELGRGGKEGGEEDGVLRGFLGQAGPAEINGPEERRGERGWPGFLLFLTFLNPFQTLNSFQSLNTSNLLQVFKLF